MAVKIIFFLLATLKYVENCLKITIVSHEYKVNFKITQAFTIFVASLCYHIFNSFLGAMYCNNLFHTSLCMYIQGFFVFCFVSNNKAVIIINILVHGLMRPLETV